MKVKYSDNLKNSFSRELLSDMVQLSFSVVPHEKYHFFKVEPHSDTLLHITHSVPSIGYKAFITRKKEKNEQYSEAPCMLAFGNNAIYVCMQDELKE